MFLLNYRTAPSSAPQYVRDIATNQTSITVEWDIMTCIDRNSEIVGYIVLRDGHYEELVPGSGNDSGIYTISGLSPYTHYFIEVAAVNSDSQTGPYAGIVVETLQDSKLTMKCLCLYLITSCIITFTTLPVACIAGSMLLPVTSVGGQPVC